MPALAARAKINLVLVDAVFTLFFHLTCLQPWRSFEKVCKNVNDQNFSFFNIKLMV